MSWDFSADPSGAEPALPPDHVGVFLHPLRYRALYNGEKWVDAVPSDFLHVPEGGIHAFRNESGEAASMLILFSPGAPREQYFETLAKRATQDLQMTPQERTEFLLRHDNHSYRRHPLPNHGTLAAKRSFRDAGPTGRGPWAATVVAVRADAAGI